MVETIAAYLGILDILVRVVKYGDRKVRRGVSSAVAAVGQPDPNLSLNDVRANFRTALDQSVGADRALLVERAVRIIEEVASAAQLAGMLENDQRRELVPYGHVLMQVVSVIGAYLDSAQVFTAWRQEEYGINDNYWIVNYVRHSVIALPYTWKLLQLAKPQSRYRADPRHPVSLCLRKEWFGFEVRYFLAAQYIAANGTRLDRAEERYGRVYLDAFHMGVEGYLTAPSSEPLSAIEFHVFEALLLGMLLDVIAYDRRIVTEINQSKLLIRNLLGLGRPSLLLPF